MRTIDMRRALQEALWEEMTSDENLILMGEDIGLYGGAYGITKGFFERFGEKRVRDCPMSEAAIVGMAAGCAINDVRAVCEVMYIDFITLAMDQVVNQAAKMRFMFGGKISVPMVIRTQGGAGRSSAAQHSQSFETWFLGIPGLKVVMPSTPYNAKGLLKSAIRDPNPVLFIEHKVLYNSKGEVPEEEYLLPIGAAEVIRPGKDITLISYSRMLSYSKEAVVELEKQGYDVEVLDLLSLRPLDIETIVKSVSKTGLAVIVEEGCKTGGVGAEISSVITENCFSLLRKPPLRIAGKDVPIACSPELEKASIPSVEEITTGVLSLCR